MKAKTARLDELNILLNMDKRKMRLSAESLMRAKQSAAERRNRMRDKQEGGGRYAIYRT